MLHSLGTVSSSSSTALYSASLSSCVLSLVCPSQHAPSFLSHCQKRLGESLQSDMRPPESWSVMSSTQLNIHNPAKISPRIALSFVKGQKTWLRCSPRGLVKIVELQAEFQNGSSRRRRKASSRPQKFMNCGCKWNLVTGLHTLAINCSFKDPFSPFVATISSKLALK